MKRHRYQSRLNKKLEEDNKVRTDVSRKSLPKENEQTLVPEITFSEIMPDETIQLPSGRLRRSNRLNLTIGNSEVGTSSTIAAIQESTKNGTAASLNESANKKAAKATKIKQPLEQSASSNQSPRIPSESVVNESRRDEDTVDGQEVGPSEGPEKSAQRLEKKTSSTDNREDVPAKESDDVGTTSRSQTTRPEELGTIEDDGKQCAPEGKQRGERGKPPAKKTLQKASKIPIPRGQTTESLKAKSPRSAMELDDGAVNDENDPNNSTLKSKPPNHDALEESQLQGEAEEEQEPNETSSRTLRTKKAVDYQIIRPRKKTIRRGEDSQQEGELSEGKANLEKAAYELKNCKVVLETIEFPEIVPEARESQLTCLTANDGDEQDVSLETLEIRERIAKKCLRNNESSDEEDRGGHGVAVNSEKLFDTLIQPTKSVPSVETLDSSSYYQGKIPSRLLSPEIHSTAESDAAEFAEGLTERFEAFKQCNSQKTAVPAASVKSTAAQEPIIASFTLEEEATNDLDEVTNRAITLCMEDDSDADLDVVMNSKPRKSAAAGNTMVDPVFCDIGTSMGLPAEQKEAESLVLMINSTSRESSENRQTQPEVVMRISHVESLCEDADHNDFVAEDDLGDEIKNPRKSKLQSTLLPSPKRHAEVAVGTGPSLMATIRETETFQNDQAEAILIDDEEEKRDDIEPMAGDCGRSGKAVQQDIEDDAVLQQNGRSSENQNGENMPAESPHAAGTVEASMAFEAPSKLLEGLQGPRASPPEDDPYETDEVSSDGEEASEQGEAPDDAAREYIWQNVDEVEGGPQRDEHGETGGKDPEDRPANEGGRGNAEMAEKISAPSAHEAGIDPNGSPEKASRASNSSDNGFLLQEDLSQPENLFEGMDSVPLLDMVDDNINALDLPEFTLISSQILSEPSSKKGKSRDDTPRLLLHKETPKSKVPLSAEYKVGRDIHKGGKRETPLSLSRETRKPRLSRRTLFDEAADIPPDILPNTTSANTTVGSSTEKRRKTFVLDSTRLPNFDDAYVETEFDARELKKRGEELFQLAARSLLDVNPEYKSVLQHAFEDLLTTLQEPIKRMMGLLVRKYALKEACEARKESYLSTQTRLVRTRKYITDTATKLMPEDECNVVKVFGFNPFEFKEPPPEPVREINKRKASEDEERFKKKLRKSN